MCTIQSCTLIEEAESKCADNTETTTIKLVVKIYHGPETDTIPVLI